jgi:hypothetical protein
MTKPRSEITTPIPAMDRKVICATWERSVSICIPEARVATDWFIFVFPLGKTIFQD